MDKTRISITIFCILLMACLAPQASSLYLRNFTFDDENALSKWKKMVLNGEVDYELLRNGQNGFVKARSDKTCSALYNNVSFKLKNYPYMKWKWRVIRFPHLSRAEDDKERDDYPARVFVIFPFLTFSSSRFLEYVWATDLPAGTVLDSPYGKNVKIIVVRSGPQSKNEWCYESRNAYEDYKMAFGREPANLVGAVAIMCDADSTRSVAEAYFDTIEISKER